ncbi:MAG: class I SAM-dependent methyltransferase [Kofleriaceae bacterium]|nr:class I SAM-dependent methyltransferase [Kofleriaceae bacterium]
MDEVQLAATRGARAVLELGCGTGRLLAQVDAPVRLGIDVAAGMLAHARARGLAVARADAHALPFADGTFDAIVAGKGVFRYLEAAVALAECARVLRPGGRLALHQYGARTWTVRGAIRAARGGARLDGRRPELHELADVDELVGPARAAGLRPRALRRYRSVRIWPYLLEIPDAVDRRAPVQLWSHLVAVLDKPGGGGVNGTGRGAD